ncbi:Response regulator PleD [compost metagenome]
MVKIIIYTLGLVIAAIISYLIGFMVGKRKGVKAISKESNAIMNDRRVVQRSDTTDEMNNLIARILEVNYKNNSLTKASKEVSLLLQQYYKLDYITILLYNSSVLNVVASNSSKAYISSIEKICNAQLKTLGNVSGKVKMVDEGYLDYASAKERQIQFSAFIPLKIHNNIIGGVFLEHTNHEYANNIRKDLYDKIFNNTALVLQNVIYTENLISKISTDQLTGVFNRRFIDITLVEQINLHKELGKSFAVALLDIDFFKKFNDTYGHQFGDIVLQQVSKYIKEKLGANSWIARYGGEEFVIFFGKQGINTAFKQLEAIRLGISSLMLTDGTQTAGVTASFGLASYPTMGNSAKQLIENADKALYKSKETGRNKVTIYENT